MSRKRITRTWYSESLAEGSKRWDYNFFILHIFISWISDTTSVKNDNIDDCRYRKRMFCKIRNVIQLLSHFCKCEANRVEPVDSFTLDASVLWNSPTDCFHILRRGTDSCFRKCCPVSRPLGTPGPCTSRVLPSWSMESAIRVVAHQGGRGLR